MAPLILRQLGIVSAQSISAHSTAGQTLAKLVEVSLSILGLTSLAGPPIVHPDLMAMELPQPIPGIDVIIGRDVILQHQLFVDGPAMQFSLSF